MPPTKHAAKKAAKHAKKHPAKHAKKHGKKHAGEHDVRRAYEHLGRLESLHELLPPSAVSQVTVLTQLAQETIRDDAHSAAELLRAAEHLSFAALATTAKERLNNRAVADALTGEFEHLRSRAEEHWQEQDAESSAVATLYADALAAADAALAKGSYRRAMELIRAAEALSHVTVADGKKLGAGASKGRALSAKRS